MAFKSAKKVIIAFKNAKKKSVGTANNNDKVTSECATIINTQQTNDSIIADDQQEKSYEVDKKSKKVENEYRSRNKSYTSDLIVVLDMDECLISVPRCYEDSIKETKVDVMHVNGILPFPVRVLLRPHLIHFLKTITSCYETHIFTAAGKENAETILDELCRTIENPQAFDKRWYSNDCTMIDIMNLGMWKINVKPLEKITGRGPNALRRIVHVDDNPDNFLLNQRNGIPVPEFTGDHNDDALLEVLEVLKNLEKADDVRPILHKKYSSQKSSYARYVE